MTQNFNPKWIIGKTIISVVMNTEKAREHGNEVFHNPIINFSDGSSISFIGEETDFGIYGVGIVYHKNDKCIIPL